MSLGIFLTLGQSQSCIGGGGSRVSIPPENEKVSGQEVCQGQVARRSPVECALAEAQTSD